MDCAMKFIYFHAFLEWCGVKLTEWKFASSWALLEGQQSQQMLDEGSRSESTATKKHISGCRRLSFFATAIFQLSKWKFYRNFFQFDLINFLLANVVWQKVKSQPEQVWTLFFYLLSMSLVRWHLRNVILIFL